MAWYPHYLNRASLDRLGVATLQADLRRNFGWSLRLIEGKEPLPSWDTSVAFVRDALAREALLLHSFGKEIPREWSEVVSAGLPVPGHTLKMVDAIKEDWVAALFPIDCGNGRAEAGIVWVGKNRSLIDPAGVSGDSWQLAGALAARARAQPTNTEAIRQRLAMKFIASGAVNSDGDVEPVREGAKSALTMPGRIWIVPHQEWIDSAALHIRSVEDAWGVVADEFVRNSDLMEPWPEQLSDFHSFTSAAYLPLIEALLCARPQRVCLWVSGDPEAQRSADLVIDFFKLELPGAFRDYRPEIRSIPVSSHDIGVVERQLFQELSAVEGAFIFHLTCGNKLQSLAASQVLARFFADKSHIVYKDRDNVTAGEMVSLRFDPGQHSPRTRLVADSVGALEKLDVSVFCQRLGDVEAIRLREVLWPSD